MTMPRLELRPARPVLLPTQTTVVTLLIRVHPASPAITPTGRVPLNLALVIDRSGSMSGAPLQMAKEAAIAATRQARPGDRISVVTFDDQVEVVVPSRLVTDPDAIIRAIQGIEAGDTTNLHGGWLEGATQVAHHLVPGSLNRVIVLSDGQANVGVTHREGVAQHVRGLTERGISTSTIGLGAHYDEELLLAMATAGDGNFEHVETPSRLPAFFEEELLGLTRTTGRVVSVGIEPNPEHRVRLQDVLNDFRRNEFGRLQLPNLVGGQAIDVVAQLAVPSTDTLLGETIGVARVRLAWTDAEGVRHKLRAQLNLPFVTPDEYNNTPDDPEVLGAAALQQAGRLKREAVQAMDRGDRAQVQRLFAGASQVVASAPMGGAAQARELEDVSALTAALEAGDDALLRKRALSQAHDRTRSKARRPSEQ